MFRLVSIILAAAALASGTASAEPIKIGMVRLAANGALFVAQEKGYFAAEGLTAELVPLEAPLAVTTAATSGAVDFGVSGPSAAFYTLGGQGALRLIAGQAREVPGFKNFTLQVSSRADAAGLKSLKDLPGHSVAIASTGSAAHYSVALIAEKYGFDLKSVRVTPTGTAANAFSAVTGGAIDAAVVVFVSALPAMARGDIKLLGAIGDETPWQYGVVYTTTKIANENPDLTRRFLRALRKGSQDYHDAFTGPDGSRQDQPTATKVLALIARNTGEAVDQLRVGIPYIDAEARLDVKDILHQIAWYKSQGMVKPEVKGEEVIDMRYVIALPEH